MDRADRQRVAPGNNLSVRKSIAIDVVSALVADAARMRRSDEVHT